MRISICSWISAVAMLLLCSVAQASSPYEEAIENTWDFDVSGAVNGVAYLTFNADKTINGIMIVAGGRPLVGTTVSEGAFLVEGDWAVDVNGNLWGNFANSPVNDIPMDITSFTGKINKNGKSFKLTAQTNFGKINYKGVPAVELPSLVEVFEDDNVIPWTIILQKYPDVNSHTYPNVTATEVYHNTYFFTGDSIRRCVVGYAALSKGNQLAVATGDWEKETVEEDGVTVVKDCEFNNLDEIDEDVSATTGQLNMRTMVANKMVGMQQSTPVEGEKSPRDKMILILGN